MTKRFVSSAECIIFDPSLPAIFVSSRSRTPYQLTSPPCLPPPRLHQAGASGFPHRLLQEHGAAAAMHLQDLQQGADAGGGPQALAQVRVCGFGPGR